MIFVIKHQNQRFKIIVRKQTRERLEKTCFRGRTVRRAGNFSQWLTLEPFFNDPCVLKAFRENIVYAYERPDCRTFSFEVFYGSPVGWSSTDDLERYHDREIEHFKPNRRSDGFRVKKTYDNLPAPQTSYLTVVFEFKREHEGPAAIVHTIYPGRNIGELRGDMAEREGIVFFDWEHPGA